MKRERERKQERQRDIVGERESNGSLILPECYLTGVLQTVLSLETLKSGQAFMCRIRYRVCASLFVSNKHQHTSAGLKFTTPLNMLFP